MELGPGWKSGMMRDYQDVLNIRWATYCPSEEPPKRWLVFLAGRTEWIEKYAYIVDDLELPSDCGVVTWDHRGQGASGGARSYVDEYDDYCRDGREVLRKIVGDHPYSMMGHSMGSLIALYGTLKGYFTPVKMALCSPLLGLPKKPIPPMIARPLASCIATLGFGPVSTGAGSHEAHSFSGNTLTHSHTRFRALRRTPYPCPSATFGWVKATFRATDFVMQPENLKRLDVPVLVLGAGDERVVDQAAIYQWVQAASAAGAEQVRLEIIPEARHELLSETPQFYGRAIRRVQSWFDDFWHDESVVPIAGEKKKEVRDVEVPSYA